MENKQTAIEWAEDEMSKLYCKAGNITLSEYHKKKKLIWEQAKQIGKEQIIKAYNAGEAVEIFELNLNLAGEEYYARRYGK